MNSNFNVNKKGYVALKRIPMGIVCDISGSMQKEKEILSNALSNFIDNLKNDLKFSKSVDALILFYNGSYEGHNGIEVKANFESLEKIDKNDLLEFVCCGYTDTGMALLEACRLLDAKKMEYQSQQTEYFQPILFLLTDGYPCAWKDAPKSKEEEVLKKYKMAIEDIHTRVNAKKLSIAAAGIQRKDGPSANIQTLKELTPNVICVSEDISELDTIDDFFDLLDDTLSAIQRDTPIEKVLHEFF
jgi:uncharacterized protein YegL